MRPTSSTSGLGAFSRARLESPPPAIRLAASLGTTPELWMNMQSRYDLWRGRPAMSVKLEENRARYYLSP
jgi:plasmid maintenance system antidote protein VapI